MASDLAGAPLARIIDERFHQAIEKPEDSKSMTEFASKFTLQEWQAAGKAMSASNSVKDLTVTEEKDKFVLHGSPAVLANAVKESNSKFDPYAALLYPGIAMVGASLLMKGSAGRVIGIFGAAWTVNGLCHREDKPIKEAAIQSWSNVSISKDHLRSTF